MKVESVSPDALNVDPMNERNDVEDLTDLTESIKKSGVVEPPIVRRSETGYTVVVGQRRVLAAREAGLDSVPVIVADYDDADALRASISENVDLFRREVSVKDRCEALQEYWQRIGGKGMPSYSHLGHELGVPSETIRAWLEPLNDEWGGTALDVDTREQTDDGEELADAVGETTLADIRRVTDGGEDGERLAQLVAEDELTRQDVRDIKADVDAGVPVDDAIAKARRDPLKLSLRFDHDISTVLREYAERTDFDPEAVVKKGVRQFLTAEEVLDGEGAISEAAADAATPDTTDKSDQKTSSLEDLL
jgi:predicted transcriptional regulator